MKHIKTLVILLLLTLLLTSCSTEALLERGVGLLDELFSGENVRPIPSSSDSQPEPATASDPEPTPEPTPAPQPVSPASEEPDITEPDTPAVTTPSSEPSVESSQPDPVESTPSTTSTTPEPSNITPSHTDVTFFSAGESFRYLPKGVTGTYSCSYASNDAKVATVDSKTGKVTAVGPGLTKVTMHVESNGQYDFECIVRCNWKTDKEEEKKDQPKTDEKTPSTPSTPSTTSTPSTPSTDDEPVLPPTISKPEEPSIPTEPVSTGVTASHFDATLFNPKEHFKLSPVGAGDDYTVSFSTSDASVASVNEKTGVVTAVGPGTATVTMMVDCGGSEYTFECIVRCNW